MALRSRTARRTITTAAVLVVAVSLLAGAALAKGTPSTLTVICDPGVSVATVTVQLVDAVATNKPASNTVVVACGPASASRQTTAVVTLKPLTQPAAAYSWSAFVTTATATFGCGGTTKRGTSATCYNQAVIPSAPPGVTILAS